MDTWLLLWLNIYLFNMILVPISWGSKCVSFFFQKMLIYDPAKRISGKMALNHPYFDNLDKSTLPAYLIKKW